MVQNKEQDLDKAVWVDQVVLLLQLFYFTIELLAFQASKSNQNSYKKKSGFCDIFVLSTFNSCASDIFDLLKKIYIQNLDKFIRNTSEKKLKKCTYSKRSYIQPKTLGDFFRLTFPFDLPN